LEVTKKPPAASANLSLPDRVESSPPLSSPRSEWAKSSISSLGEKVGLKICETLLVLVFETISWVHGQVDRLKNRLSVYSLRNPLYLRDQFIKDPYAVLNFLCDVFLQNPKDVEKILEPVLQAWNKNPKNFFSYNPQNISDRKNLIAHLNEIFHKFFLNPALKAFQNELLSDSLNGAELAAMTRQISPSDSPEAKRSNRAFQTIQQTKQKADEQVWGAIYTYIVGLQEQDSSWFKDLKLHSETEYKKTEGPSDTIELTFGIFVERALNHWGILSLGYETYQANLILFIRDVLTYLGRQNDINPQIQQLITKLTRVFASNQEQNLKSLLQKVHAIYAKS